MSQAIGAASCFPRAWFVQCSCSKVAQCRVSPHGKGQGKECKARRSKQVLVSDISFKSYIHAAKSVFQICGIISVLRVLCVCFARVCVFCVTTHTLSLFTAVRHAQLARVMEVLDDGRSSSLPRFERSRSWNVRGSKST